MKSLKKFAAASMTCAALLGFAATSHAAYQLNDEVKDATPALLMASQVGVKTNVNPALANLPDKDAIVVMSFGTTFKDSREKTINPTVEAYGSDNAGGKSSKMIADRLEISKHTVDRHRQNIIAKLRVNNTTEACHKAKRLGLID